MIIVTGAHGFIGSNLVRTLIDQGETDILAVDYTTRSYLDELPITVVSARDFYADKNHYIGNKTVNAFFHEGAISSTTETDEKKLFSYNTHCTLQLMNFCRDNKIPLSYASSASVYGNMPKAQWHMNPKPMNPLNAYAKSKQQIDHIAKLMFNNVNSPVLLQGFRYFNVYGPYEDHKSGQSSPYATFSEQLANTGKIKLFENSENYYRDFVSVERVVELKLRALDSMPSGIYDIGSGEPRSFYDVAVEVCSLSGIEDPNTVIEYIPMPENLKEHYQEYSIADMSWVSRLPS